MSEWELYLNGFKTLNVWSDAPKYTGIIGILYDWQTLISGLLAIVAGAAVWWQVRLQRTQINDERDKHIDLMQRRERSARMRIPHALSKLSQFFEDGYKAFENRKLHDLSLPQEPIETLMSVSESIDAQSYESVKELVDHLQVFEARHLRLKNPMERSESLALVDLAKLKFMTDRLYELGRAKNHAPVPFVMPTREELEALMLRNCHLFKMMDARREALTERILAAFDRQYGKKRYDSNGLDDAKT